MKPIRYTHRFLRLLGHLFHGIYLVLTCQRYPTKNGESLPDPQLVSDWLKHLLEILNIQVTVTGPVPHKRSLLVANHVSWLDIPVIASATHSAFLSKHSIRKWPVIGWLAASAGTVFIKRGQGEAQQVATAISQRLDGDRQLAIFPEGTTTDGTSVKRFFPRLFATAIETETNVIPVTLSYSVDGKQDTLAPYTNNQNFITNIFGLMGRESSQVRLDFGEPIPPMGKDRKTLAEETRQLIADNLVRLKADQTDSS